MRTFQTGTLSNVLTVDSGWTKQGVTIDVQTSRGKTVTLTVEEWRELNAAVERIITHCEAQRQQQEKENR